MCLYLLPCNWLGGVRWWWGYFSFSTYLHQMENWGTQQRSALRKYPLALVNVPRLLNTSTNSPHGTHAGGDGEGIKKKKKQRERGLSAPIVIFTKVFTTQFSEQEIKQAGCWELAVGVGGLGAPWAVREFAGAAWGLRIRGRQSLFRSMSVFSFASHHSNLTTEQRDGETEASLHWVLLRNGTHVAASSSSSPCFSFSSTVKPLKKIDWHLFPFTIAFRWLHMLLT